VLLHEGGPSIDNALIEKRITISGTSDLTARSAERIMIQHEPAMGTGMVYFGMSSWDGMWKNRHQLMSRFARHMPVLYVEPWRWLKKVRRELLRGDFRSTSGSAPRCSLVADNLHVFHSPASLAVSGSGVLRNLTQNRWYAAIRKAARQIGIADPILWISRPEMIRAIGRMGERLSIYHIVDEYGGYTGQDEAMKQRLWEAERELLDAVDMSIVVSPELLEVKSGPGRAVYLVENAVDVQQYQERMRCAEAPEDIASIACPRLGYSGLIGKRLDLPMLLELASRNPGWSLVLIGKVDARDCQQELAALQSLDNVHFLGEKKHDAVADYVTSLDVGLLPYRINLETRNISPLKMYEYLAAGLPVVSTRIPAAERNARILHIADDTAGFVGACRIAMQDADDAVQQRIEFARANTWDARVEQIWDLISARLGGGQWTAAAN